MHDDVANAAAGALVLAAGITGSGSIAPSAAVVACTWAPSASAATRHRAPSPTLPAERRVRFGIEARDEHTTDTARATRSAARTGRRLSGVRRRHCPATDLALWRR
jgi:hypothetical protein